MQVVRHSLVSLACGVGGTSLKTSALLSMFMSLLESSSVLRGQQVPLHWGTQILHCRKMFILGLQEVVAFCLQKHFLFLGYCTITSNSAESLTYVAEIGQQ
uniref:Uncharacterized protein LOC111114943 isoform X2 n=1 Tax=Crassostrea virginica TaxID=6565 RepID=A0A8B8C0N3_CRAVI|nr:uncharacterized protein LOC111114943 isoform X2 [Crassostrea virginica]